MDCVAFMKRLCLGYGRSDRFSRTRFYKMRTLCCNVLFYFKVVLENLSRGEDYECPFARASIALTKMLCEVLEINSEPRKLWLIFTSHIYELP